MPKHHYLYLPYIPNREGKRKAPRPSPHSYLHRIAYTLMMTGMEDDTPTLLFLGAPFALLKDACEYIVKIMAGKVADMIIRPEHSCRVKNGKQYWRWAVDIIGLDEAFISLQEFALLVISRIKRICNCTVRRYNVEPFFNL